MADTQQFANFGPPWQGWDMWPNIDSWVYSYCLFTRKWWQTMILIFCTYGLVRSPQARQQFLKWRLSAVMRVEMSCASTGGCSSPNNHLEVSWFMIRSCPSWEFFEEFRGFLMFRVYCAESVGLTIVDWNFVLHPGTQYSYEEQVDSQPPGMHIHFLIAQVQQWVRVPM